MTRSKKQVANPPSRTRESARPKQQPSTTKRPLWQKPLVWIGGVLTAVTAGVLIGVLTPVAQRATAPLPPGGSKAAPLASGSANGSPLKILSEAPLNLAELGLWALPGNVAVNPAELQQVNTGDETSGSFTPLARYMQSVNGFPVNVDTQIVFQNRRDHAIRILGMNVVKSCGPPVTGTLFYGPGQAAFETIQIGFNLDSDDTAARVWSHGVIPPSSPDYFTKYTVVMKPGAQQVFNVTAQTDQQSCIFRYRATILDGDKTVYQTIGNGGQPFRESALVESGSSRPFTGYGNLYVNGTSFATARTFTHANPETYSFQGG